MVRRLKEFLNFERKTLCLRLKPKRMPSSGTTWNSYSRWSSWWMNLIGKTRRNEMIQRRLSLLALVVFVTVTASGCGYNTLTTKQQNVKAKWANVETQLQRRSDLLNNLVESAKLAGVQEQEVFGKIAEARSRLLNATQQAPQGEGGDKTPEQKQAVIDAANSFGGTIGRLLVLQENYPVLKSNENFLK